MQVAFRTMTKIRGGLVTIIYRKMLTIRAETTNSAQALSLMSTDVDRITMTTFLCVKLAPDIVQLIVALAILGTKLGTVTIAPWSYAPCASASPHVSARWCRRGSGGGWQQSKSAWASPRTLLPPSRVSRWRGLARMPRSRSTGCGSLSSTAPCSSARCRSRRSFWASSTSFVSPCLSNSQGLRKKLDIKAAYWQSPLSRCLPDPPAARRDVHRVRDRAEDFGQQSVQCRRGLHLTQPTEYPRRARYGHDNSLDQSFFCPRLPRPDPNLFTERESRRLPHPCVPGRPHAQRKRRLVSPSPWQVGPRKSPQEPVVKIRGGNFGWSKEGGDAVLRDIDLDIRPSELTLIVGPVGSGKTSLLESMLGEARLISGSVEVTIVEEIAYCGQDAWLLNRTRVLYIPDNDQLYRMRYPVPLPALLRESLPHFSVQTCPLPLSSLWLWSAGTGGNRSSGNNAQFNVLHPVVVLGDLAVMQARRLLHRRAPVYPAVPHQRQPVSYRGTRWGWSQPSCLRLPFPRLTPSAGRRRSGPGRPSRRRLLTQPPWPFDDGERFAADRVGREHDPGLPNAPAAGRQPRYWQYFPRIPVLHGDRSPVPHRARPSSSGAERSAASPLILR